MLVSFLAVGLGGAIGAILRYTISFNLARAAPGLPFGTFVSNTIAGFFCGLVVCLGKNSAHLSPHAVLFLTTGIMGGLSTFSTFSVETVDLLENERFFLAAANILGNLAFSLLAAVLGIQMGKKLI